MKITEEMRQEMIAYYNHESDWFDKQIGRCWTGLICFILLFVIVVFGCVIYGVVRYYI